MFQHQSINKFTAGLSLLCILVAACLFTVSNELANTQNASPQQDPIVQLPERENKPQRIFAPHWTSEGSLYTIIYIRNMNIQQAIKIRASLIINDRIVVLPDTFINPFNTVSIDVEKALIEGGEKVDQSGAAVIDFEADSAGEISAYAQVLDTRKSLGFSFPFMEAGFSGSGPLDAVAWYFSENTDAFIALQNTTEEKIKASLTLFVSGQPISLGNRQLKPHEAITVKLPPAQSRGHSTASRSTGVHIEYESTSRGLLAQGWVMDESIGFSAPFTFSPKSNCNCADDTQHLYGTGVEIGSAGGMMGLALGATFSPYLAASNRSGKPLTVTPLFKYDTEEGIERVALPKITLGPQNSALLNLKDYQDSGLIPLWVAHGNIDLQYRGESGALVAELTSVDQNGSFVSPVPLICSGSNALYMPFWRTDGGWHSSVTIENISPEEIKVEAAVSYSGGIYVLEKSIAAGATAMVSVNELQQSQEPDREGRHIPASAILGGIKVWSPEGITGLVVNAMLVNPVTRTCGSCSGFLWARQWYLSDKRTYNGGPLGGFDPHISGEVFQMYINVVWSDWSQSDVTIGNSSSSNGSVATVTGSSVNTGNPGTTNLSATSSSYYFYNSVCSSGIQLSASSSLLVLRITFQKADGTALPSPLRVGISATTLNGTVHDRKKPLRAVIEPSSEAGGVSIQVTSKLQLSDVSTSGGIISFKVVGISKSASRGDSTIKAVRSGKTMSTATVSVVVPDRVATPHDTTGGGVVIANRVLDATTSPAITGVPPGQVLLSTIYARYLTITVKDQFGDLIGDIYEGAEVSEPDSLGQLTSINQPLTSSSTYSDPVGFKEDCCTAAAGSSQAISWPTQSKIPLRSGTFSLTQNISVYVDGFTLNPAIQNRVVTLSGDGTSVTSPPVSVTVSWP